MTENLEEITTADSVVPVYLDPTPREPSEDANPEDALVETTALRQAGIDKLITLGLTEDEALAIAGV